MEPTKVKLIADNGVEDFFGIEHAERILKMGNSGWKLPENSEFIFDKNGIDFRGNKGQNSETGENTGNRRRRLSSESD